MSIYALINASCPCPWHPLILLVFYVAQCLSLVYKKHHQNHRLICPQHQPLSCQNCHHMKNNVRYECNINKTSVIIFFNWRTKTPNNATLLGGTSSWFFVMLVVVFHSFLFFVFFFILLLLLFFISLFLMWCCSSHRFSTSSLTLPPPLTLPPGFYTHFILSAQPNAEWFVTLSFEPFRGLLSQFYGERYGFEWAFFTHRHFFTLCFFTDILPVFIKASFPWEPAVLPWSLQGFILIPEKHRPGAYVCFIHSNPQSS